MLYLRLTLYFLFIAIISQAHGSDSTEDVVYLKDGSVVRGQIVEQVPGDYVRMQTIGGSVFVFEVSEIANIKKEPQMPIAKKKHPILAATMSMVLPGLGQFYTEEYGAGFGYVLVTVVGTAFWVAGKNDRFTFWSIKRDVGITDYEVRNSWQSCVGSALWGAALVNSAMNAYKSAKQMNERNQQAHLFQRDGDRFTVGIDAITSRKRLGTMVSLRF